MPTVCPNGFADTGACVAPTLVGAGWGWPKLLRMALDQRRRLGRNYAGERETGGRKERAEVRFGTFTTTNHEHQQFHNSDGAGGRINDFFDEKEGSVRTHGTARVAKDFGRNVLLPIAV